MADGQAVTQYVVHFHDDGWWFGFAYGAIMALLLAGSAAAAAHLLGHWRAVPRKSEG